MVFMRESNGLNQCFFKPQPAKVYPYPHLKKKKKGTENTMLNHA